MHGHEAEEAERIVNRLRFTKSSTMWKNITSNFSLAVDSHLHLAFASHPANTEQSRLKINLGHGMTRDVLG